jgi:hypothetical protein
MEMRPRDVKKVGNFSLAVSGCPLKKGCGVLR